MQQTDDEVHRPIGYAVPDRIYNLILNMSHVTRLIRVVTYVFRFSKMDKLSRADRSREGQ